MLLAWLSRVETAPFLKHLYLGHLPTLSRSLSLSHSSLIHNSYTNTRITQLAKAQCTAYNNDVVYVVVMLLMYYVFQRNNDTKLLT